MQKKLDLLTVLGRGIYQDEKIGQWFPDKDFVMWGITDGYYGSIANQETADEESPDCFLGGGELNLLAGVEIYKQRGAKLVVCAYGDRANYLKKIGGSPAEGKIDTAEFLRLVQAAGLTMPEVEVWTDDMSAPGFNTYWELINVFSLAVKRGFRDIGVVTITSHLPRTILFADRHLTSVKEFKDLRVEYFSAELVLAAADPTRYVQRALNIFSSPAFKRSAGLERKGAGDFLEGRYGK